MFTCVLACEGLRPELELLAAKLPGSPPMQFLPQEYHKYPPVLGGKLQEAIDKLERENEGDLTIICAYGLCGRGTCGVSASRATLVFPRVHDCTPLILGLEQERFDALPEAVSTYWLTPGLLEHEQVPYHMNSQKSFQENVRKLGLAAAKRLLDTDNAWLRACTRACLIRWPELGEACADDARMVADGVPLPYTEMEGSPTYLTALLEGGRDPEKFLRLEPGQTLDLDDAGRVCAVSRADMFI